jgi:hypothetical protein
LPGTNTLAYYEHLVNYGHKKFYNKWALVVPEYVNVILLSLAIYGMYQGIKIKHPLYTILFTALIVALLSSVTDILAFFFVSTKQYIKGPML